MHLRCCIVTLQIACVAHEHLCGHITGKFNSFLPKDKHIGHMLFIQNKSVKVYKNTLYTCGTTANILQIREICMDGTVQ